MKLLIKERASGKTTGLVYTSEATGFPICVTVRSRVNFILQLAAELGCNIPQPITVEELKDRFGNRHRPENILYDEVGEIIGAALDNYLGTHVVCGTMSDYEKKSRYKGEQKYEHEDKLEISINYWGGCIGSDFARCVWNTGRTEQSHFIGGTG